MMFQPNHTGLYFGPEDVLRANQDAMREPLLATWALLNAAEPEPETLPSIMRNGLRYALKGESDAGATGIADLLRHTTQSLADSSSYLQSAATLTAMIQCFELLRSHPDFVRRGEWLDWLFEQVSMINQPTFDLAHHERLWLALVNVAAGIALERLPIFDEGTKVYHQTIDKSVHPEGYIKPAVEDHKDRDGLFRLLWSVKALVLMAEAATCAGVNLWRYEFRGVGLITAALYPLAYYFRPDKWQWSRDPNPDVEVPPLTVEEVEPLFKQHGAFYEMVNRRAEKQKAVTLFLQAQRPLFDVYGGGLTTLTHGVAKRRGLFG
jgi:hypothetical protein